MLLTKEQIKQFEKVVKPLIKYIAENYHPHVKVIATCRNAEILEGHAIINTDGFILEVQED